MTKNGSGPTLPEQVTLQYFILLLPPLKVHEWRFCNSDGLELTMHLLHDNRSLFDSHGFITSVLIKREMTFLSNTYYPNKIKFAIFYFQSCFAFIDNSPNRKRIYISHNLTT